MHARLSNCAPIGPEGILLGRAQVRKNLPGKIEILPGMGRRLQQDPLADGPPGTIPEATQPYAAEAPLTAPGPPLSWAACPSYLPQCSEHLCM
jgi:hypothetical protein